MDREDFIRTMETVTVLAELLRREVDSYCPSTPEIAQVLTFLDELPAVVERALEADLDDADEDDVEIRAARLERERDELRDACEAVAHELLHGEASESEPRGLAWCRETLAGAVLRTSGWKRDDSMVRDLLGLVLEDGIPEDVITGWTDEQAYQAERWASAMHLFASDNDDVRVPPTPAHVKAAAGEPLADQYGGAR